MPRKKSKNRYNGPQKSGELDLRTDASLAASSDTVITNLAADDNLADQNKLKLLQEMFDQRLDPDVVQMVFQECNFNVEQALENLFELANANGQNSSNKQSIPNAVACDPSSPESSPSATQSSHFTCTNSPSMTTDTTENTQVPFIISNSSQHTNIRNDNAKSTNQSPFTAQNRLSNISCASSLSLQQPQSKSPLNVLMPYANLFSSHKQYSFKQYNPNYNKIPSQNTNKARHSLKDEIKRLIIAGTDKILVLLRGLPGSGKSMLAENLLNGSRNGVILSADQYFIDKRDRIYKFDPFLLPLAHEATQKNAQSCISKGVSPIIIDNTNLESWEMKPYVIMAHKAGYKTFLLEPETPWKMNIKELSKKNKHGVPREKIQMMATRFENVTVENLITMFVNDEAKYPQNRKDIQSRNNKDYHDSTIALSSFHTDIGKMSPTRLSPSATSVKSQVATFISQNHSNSSNSFTPNSGQSPTDSPNAKIDLNFLLALSERNDSETSSLHASEVGSQESGWEKDEEFTWNGASTCTVSSKTVQNDEEKSIQSNNQENDSTLKSEKLENHSEIKQKTTETERNDNDSNFVETQTSNENSSNLRRAFGLVGIKRSNWEFPPFPSNDNQNFDNFDCEFVDLLSNESQTESKDWAFLELSQSQECNDVEGTNSSVRFKMKNSQMKVDNENILKLPKNRNENKVFLEKGTFTNDLPETLTEEEKLIELKHSFPKAEESHLSEILDACHGDLNWANKLLNEFDDDHFQVSSLELTSSDIGTEKDNNSSDSSENGMQLQELQSPKPQSPETEFILKLDPSIAAQLEKLFGKISDEYPIPKEYLVVHLSIGTARLLHHHWKKTYQQKLYNQASNQLNKTNGKNNYQKRNFENGKKDRCSLKEHLPKSEFQEIMDLELALAQSRKEYDQLGLTATKEFISTKLKVEQLYKRYPAVDKTFLDEVFESKKFNLGETLKFLDETLGETADFTNETEELLSEENNSSYGSRSNSPLKTDQSKVTKRTIEEIQNIISEMNELLIKKKEFHDKAHTAYQRKMFAVASYYGDEAGALDAEINKISKEVVDYFLSNSINTNILDLHGFNVAQTNSIVAEFLRRKSEELKKSFGRKKLQIDIITGYGATKGVQGKLLPVVTQYLKQKNYRFEMKNPGAITVTLTQ